MVFVKTVMGYKLNDEELIIMRQCPKCKRELDSISHDHSCDKTYEFEAVIQKANDDTDTAYVAVPIDIRAEFGKGRLKVHATFDSVCYDGSIVNMGVKNPDGSICYIIGIRKDIRAKIGKQVGDIVNVTFSERMKVGNAPENRLIWKG